MKAKSKLVYGVGINDSNAQVSMKINGKQVFEISYRAWKGVLERCYDEKFHKRLPTYIGVRVCDDWRFFSKFKSWFDYSYVDGWHLDKDLLSDERIYSPGTCIYVPGWLNTFTIDRHNSRGYYPIGASLDKCSGKFTSKCSNPLGGREHLGYFSYPHLASEAWRSRKLELAEELKPIMDDIDTRIYPRVVTIIKRAR
ncbi:MAG: hypothetical protein ACRDC6_32060 [Shewanella sp.]